MIELLVVVAIIALLASLLLPALRTARAKSRTTKCVANLRQIGLGFQMYLDDHHGFLPPLNAASSYNAAGTAGAYGMWNCIGPYTGLRQWAGLNPPPLGNNEPEDPTRIKSSAYWGKWKQKYGLKNTVWGCPENDPNECPWGATYAESLYLQTPGGWGGANPRAWSVPRPFGAIARPANAIHVAEATDWHLGGIANVGNVGSVFDLTKHQNGGNILFTDGHAGWYSSGYVSNNIVRDASATSMNNFNLR
ncbi:MAG: hypothetical protein PCFJNLEI_01014 [Verrucomicrobiae bacterium]|nr:hypothetical protein [Verrucomicrobiae bacterium]